MKAAGSTALGVGFAGLDMEIIWTTRAAVAVVLCRQRSDSAPTSVPVTPGHAPVLVRSKYDVGTVVVALSDGTREDLVLHTVAMRRQ